MFKKDKKHQDQDDHNPQLPFEHSSRMVENKINELIITREKHNIIMNEISTDLYNRLTPPHPSTEGVPL